MQGSVSDELYYGDKEFLSNSDIGTLLSNPAMFKKPKEKTVPMVQGSYFHALMIEPEKVDSFMIVDASSRNTNVYKQTSGDDVLLLKPEAESIRAMADTLKGNFSMYDMIYDDDNLYEQASSGIIMGNKWKGKADIVNPTLLVDLKTTSDLDGFKWSARKYNYDSQAWIYNQLFGKPMVFIVIEKETHRIALFECSDEFLDYGRQKVEMATEVYNKFFGPNKTHDIAQYYKTETL